MMKQILVVLLGVVSCNVGLAQIENKQDYVWLFGHDSDLNFDGIESFTFNFNLLSSDIPNGERGKIPIWFIGNNASICDKDGNLLFYSNGCEVADSTHQVMPNGFGLNAGEFIELYRNGECEDYPGRQDILILPDPSDNSNYFVLHKRIELNNESRFSHNTLSYSTVDLDENNGLGDVQTKNIALFDSLKFMASYLNTVLHENQKDWWVSQPLDKSDSILIFRIGESGIEDVKF